MLQKKQRYCPAVWCLAVLLFLCLFSTETQAKVKAPKKECHAYAVMDAGSGELLFGQDADKVIYPASTAKLMTAIVCVEQGNVNGKIKTKSEIVNNTTYGTYSLGIGAGITFRFKDLLNMSLMASAADATDSLAAGVFGSKQKCVEAMNAKCRELGLKKTSFDNPVGSDIGAGFKKTYSTAREMALITRYAMANPLIRSTVAKVHCETKGYYFNTTNWFLRGMAWYDEDKYTIIGSKSGTTNAAGHVFIATAVDDEGHEVICAYFGNVSKESTFTSIRKLLDYTFRKYHEGKLTLTKSNYDVRISKKYKEVYDRYAALNCYPTGDSGLFRPNRAITRKELGKLLKGADSLKGNATLNVFMQGNMDGTVTALRFATLLSELYPAHLSGEETEALLADNPATAELSEEEKEAFAIFIKNGFAVDKSCQNPSQILTRGQALLMADKLADYQIRYFASHPQSPDREAAVTQTDDIKDFLGTPSLTLNLKWKNSLKTQAAQRKAEAKKAAQAAKAEAAEETTANTETTATTAEKKTKAPEKSAEPAGK